MKNKSRLTQVLIARGDPFTADDSDLCTLLTKEVMDNNKAKGLIPRDDIGRQLFESFVEVRPIDIHMGSYEEKGNIHMQRCKYNDKSESR